MLQPLQQCLTIIHPGSWAIPNAPRVALSEPIFPVFAWKNKSLGSIMSVWIHAAHDSHVYSPACTCQKTHMFCGNIFCVFCVTDELDTSTLYILVGDTFHQGIFLHILSHLKPVHLTCFIKSICLCSYKYDVRNYEISYLLHDHVLQCAAVSSVPA
jgi:hypothetical protein